MLLQEFFAALPDHVGVAFVVVVHLDPNSEIGRTIIENDCGAVLQDPTGPQVAEMLRTLLHDRERLRQMGENGRAAYLRNYTLTLAVERYDACLSAVF